MIAHSRTMRVNAIRPNGIGNIDIELLPLAEEPLASFEPGSHIDVLTPSGGIRQYSLCNGPAEREAYHLCVRLEEGSRGGSASLHGDLLVGHRIEVSAPRNLFPLPAAAHYLLFAGGIGITPLFAMAQALAERGAGFELHYYLRSRAAGAFVNSLETAPWRERVFLHVSEEGDGLRAAVPACLQRPRSDAAILACGPSGFMGHLRGLATSAGWADGQFHCERFSTDESAFEPGAAFDIEVASTGQRFHVGEHATIAGVLQENGVPVELSCEQGMCGACLTGVVSGVPDHRDMILSDAERAANDRIAVCCSRACSATLTLDL